MTSPTGRRSGPRWRRGASTSSPGSRIWRFYTPNIFSIQKIFFLTVQIFSGRHVPVEPQRAGQPQPPAVVRGQLRVAGVRQ